MKRVLLAVLIGLALAMPVCGATGSATWNGVTNTDWETDTNWTPAQHPADTHTATFDGTVGEGLPDTNLPAAGTISFAVTGTHTLTLAALLDGAAIGTVLVNDAAADISIGANVTGTTTVTSGILLVDDDYELQAVELAGAAGYFVVAGSKTATVTGVLTVSADGWMAVGTAGVLDCNGGITITSPCSWSVLGAMRGCPDADGNAQDWETSTGTLTVDQDGTLDLGGDVWSMDITVTAETVVLSGRKLVMAGTLTAPGVTMTVASEAQIDCGGTGTVTDVTVSGNRLVVRRAVHSSTGIPLRGWNDDSCVNVRFLGRRVIGAPGVN